MNDDIRAGLDGAIVDGRHVMSVRIYYEDTDFAGVVYYANYLRFMERGRTNYLRLLGIDQVTLFDRDADGKAAGFAFVVRSLTIDYLKPACMDDVIEVTTTPVEVKGASIVLEQTVTRGDTLLVTATVRVACVSGGHPCRIPQSVRTAMSADITRQMPG